jgi:hypothetical protein
LRDELKKLATDFGINEELCVFMDNYSIDKDQKDYMEWLDAVKEFVVKNKN